jgi:hypothetical protein
VYASRGWMFWKAPKPGAWVKLGKEWDKAARERWVELSTGNGAEGSVAAMLDAHMAYRGQLKTGYFWKIAAIFGSRAPTRA